MVWLVSDGRSGGARREAGVALRSVLGCVCIAGLVGWLSAPPALDAPTAHARAATPSAPERDAAGERAPARTTTAAPSPPVVSAPEPTTAAEPTPSPAALAVQGHLDRLRRLTVAVRTLAPEAFGPAALPTERAPGPVADDPDALLAALGPELALLDQAVVAVTGAGEPSPAPAVESAQTLSGAGGTYEVEVDAVAVENAYVALVNVGDVPVSAPRLAVNGQPDWHDLDSLLDEVRADATSERELALGLWDFLVENRFHEDPAHNDDENHDPVRFFNIYGYGYCDDAAEVYANMAAALGLEARVWALNGHVVPEVRYDDDWHLLDPDGETYYLDVDGADIASVAELEATPDLLDVPVLRPGVEQPFYRPAKVKPFYASVEDNRFYAREPGATFHSMAFTLRPGERIERRWSQEGYRFCNRYWDWLDRFGNGTWSYGCELRAGDDDVPFELPYPILGGHVAVDLPDDAARDQWIVEVSTSGGAWRPAPWGGSDADGRPVAGLQTLLGNGHGDPDYALRVRVRGPAGESSTVGVHTELTFQLAPAALPALQPGVNVVEWSQADPAGQLQVVHGWREAGS